MKNPYKTFIFICAVLFAQSVFAQAPSISYATPQTYAAGAYITPLVPTNSGVGAPGYSTITLASGIGSPQFVAVDKKGNVYVTDSLSVYKITAGVKTSIGSGILYPEGIAVDAAGNVYVADEGHSAIYKILAANGQTTVFAQGRRIKNLIR